MSEGVTGSTLVPRRDVGDGNNLNDARGDFIGDQESEGADGRFRRPWSVTGPRNPAVDVAVIS